MPAPAENTQSAIELLVDRAGHIAATIIATETDALTAALEVRYADGARSPFLLRVEAAGRSAAAKELEPCNLPAFCPMRHINADGTFCLYWTAVDDILIKDAEDADAWWETVLKFLMQQRRAARRGIWPDNRERAHGEAALHQHHAELAAEAIGPTIAADLAARRLAVIARPSRHNERVLRVVREGRRFYSVWADTAQVVTKRRPCICATARDHRSRAIASCGDHHQRAIELAMCLKAQEAAEAEFWRDFAGRPCCGTMKGCPLGRAV